MKTCPICRSRTFDDAEVCYGCLHAFKAQEGIDIEEPSPKVLPDKAPLEGKASLEDKTLLEGIVPLEDKTLQDGQSPQVTSPLPTQNATASASPVSPSPVQNTEESAPSASPLSVQNAETSASPAMRSVITLPIPLHASCANTNTNAPANTNTPANSNTNVSSSTNVNAGMFVNTRASTSATANTNANTNANAPANTNASTNAHMSQNSCTSANASGFLPLATLMCDHESGMIRLELPWPVVVRSNPESLQTCASARVHM